jgi:hypothetical protein
MCFALALRDVFYGFAGDPDSGVEGCAAFARWDKELLGGALHVHIPVAARIGVGVSAGASAATGSADPCVGARDK